MELTIDDLVRNEFKGTFQRNMSAIRDELNLRKNDPKALQEYKSQFYITNKKHDFSLIIYSYNPKSGLFLAKGKDYFGESGIIGAINFTEIKFQKIYVKEGLTKRKLLHTKEFVDDYINFRVIEYWGAITKNINKNQKITAFGNYRVRHLSLRFWGNWHMETPIKLFS